MPMTYPRRTKLLTPHSRAARLHRSRANPIEKIGPLFVRFRATCPGQARSNAMSRAAFKSGGRPRKNANSTHGNLCARQLLLFFTPSSPSLLSLTLPRTRFLCTPADNEKIPKLKQEQKHTHTHGVIPSNRNTQHQKQYREVTRAHTELLP